MFKQIPNGEYYYFPKGCKTTEMVVKDTNIGVGRLNNNLTVPKKFIGKRVRLKLELVEGE